MGVSVITSTLRRIFQTIEDHDGFETTIDKVITHVLEDDDRDGEFWDQINTEIPNVLKFEHFINFVLLPHVTVLLIAEDLELNPNDDAASKAYRSSEEYGKSIFNDVDDDNIDVIALRNIRAIFNSASNTTIAVSLPNSWIILGVD